MMALTSHIEAGSSRRGQHWRSEQLKQVQVQQGKALIVVGDTHNGAADRGRSSESLQASSQLQAEEGWSGQRHGEDDPSAV